jgi:hypothetical protein
VKNNPMGKKYFSIIWYWKNKEKRIKTQRANCSGAKILLHRDFTSWHCDL